MSDETNSLRDLSDALLGEVDAVRRLEREKRQEEISSPEFHALADEIERRSRRVFSIAAEEETAGDRAPRQDRSIDDLGRPGPP